MAKSCNNFGQVVEGSVVQLPDNEDVFVVCEIRSNICKLYYLRDSSYFGDYALDYIKNYIL